MKKRRLGNTKLHLSEIGLGGWQIGGFKTINEHPITYGNVKKNIADKIVKTAIELGINTFDTADTYALGNSERRLGESLKNYRAEVCILTKAGLVPNYNSNKIFDIDLSYQHLVTSLDKSLKRLGTDYVDLFQIHKPPHTLEEFENIEKAFNKMKSENKTLYCGASIGREYEIGMKLVNSGLIDSLQFHFSLLDFKAIKQLIPLCKKKNIGIIVSEPLCQGFLSGKYSRNQFFPISDIRSTFSKKLVNKLFQQSQKFEFLVNESRKMNNIALKYILSKKEITTCIPGAKNTTQLESNINSLKTSLNEKELEQIKEIQKTL